MLLLCKDCNVEASNHAHQTEKNFYSITAEEILAHLVILKACFENEPSLQAKEGSRQKSCQKFFVQKCLLRRKNNFFLLLASLNLLFKTSLSQKLELNLEYWCVLVLSPGGTEILGPGVF